MRTIITIGISFLLLLLIGCMSDKSNFLCQQLKESTKNKNITIRSENNLCVIEIENWDSIKKLSCNSFTQTATIMVKYIKNDTSENAFDKKPSIWCKWYTVR